MKLEEIRARAERLRSVRDADWRDQIYHYDARETALNLYRDVLFLIAAGSEYPAAMAAAALEAEETE